MFISRRAEVSRGQTSLLQDCYTPAEKRRSLMPMSPHLRRLRDRIGHDLITLPSVTACIFNTSGRMLFVLHDEGVWVLPGGAIEPNERPLDAVCREAWEETGLRVDPHTLIGVYGGPEFLVTYRNGDQVSYVMMAYLCEVLGGQLQPDGREVHELRYLGEKELVDFALPTWVHLVAGEAFAAAHAKRSDE
jgi:8-oxo-dGTP pyrophosphatase MutT (NUDIX family)